MITLKYDEVDWIENPHATDAVNVNPFNVLVFSGNVKLDPPSDNWSRTIYVNNFRTESTGNRWVESSNIVSNREVGRRHVHHFSREQKGNMTIVRRGSVNTITRRVERQFVNNLVGSAQERDYVESTKVSSEADPFMRSRNVMFATSGLKPFTLHYHFLDSGIPDIVPKIFEIEMSSGTFSVFEDVKVEVNGTQIGLILYLIHI